MFRDRFIPFRRDPSIAHFNLVHSNLDNVSGIEFHNESSSAMNFLNTADKAKRILHRRKLFLNALNIIVGPILRPPAIEKKAYATTEALNKNLSWPVRSRKSHLIPKTEVQLDLPDFSQISDYAYRQMIDWGTNGFLSTVFENEVYMVSTIGGEFRNTSTNCVVSKCAKWDPTGKRLAASTSSSVLLIDGGDLKDTGLSVKCLSLKCCKISALEWTSSCELIMGCSNGHISVRDIVFKCCVGAIIDLKRSCHSKYLFAISKAGYPYVYKCPLKQETQSLLPRKKFKVESMAWHPWKENLLVIGQADKTVTVWNLHAEKAVASKVITPLFGNQIHYSLVYLTFNPLSAELLISFYYNNLETNVKCSIICVCSDLFNIVDEIRCHLGKVPYVVWDNTGTQFATASTDETLGVWSFFGSSADAILKREKEENKRRAMMGVTLSFADRMIR